MDHIQKHILIPMDKYKRLLAQQQERGTSSMEKPDFMSDNPMDIDLILSVLPKPSRQRGAALIKHIQNDPDQRLTWNQKGQVIYKGQLIQGSHIADLLKDSQYLYKRLQPQGKAEFYQALREMNVPQGLIGNRQRWEIDMNTNHPIESKGPDPLPNELPSLSEHFLKRPPGLPEKKSQKTFKWISL